MVDRTIRVDDYSYAMIKAFKNLLDEIMPINIPLGNAAAIGSIIGLAGFAKAKVNLMKTAKGQMYLKIIEALKEVNQKKW